MILFRDLIASSSIFEDIEERARKEALELMIVKEVFMNDFEFIIYAFCC